MNKKTGSLGLLLFIILLMTGCAPDSMKSTSIISMYAITSFLSLVLLIGCAIMIRKRDKWFMLLSASIFTVNTGYLALAASKTLGAALMANRLAYFGSVFLPLSMMMIILNVCKTKYRKRLPVSLFVLSAIVFLIAASPGILDLYYKEVSLSFVNGVAVLNKVYGPLHPLYMVYLLGYFAAMAIVIFRASAKKQLKSTMHAVSLATAVFINIGVWLLEQFVNFGVELLAVSYILSELFLTALYLFQIEHDRLMASRLPAENASPTELHTSEEAIEEELPADEIPFEEKCAYFAAQLICLTPTEQLVYSAYLEGKSTKEIMQDMNIKESTLKYHNRNIYGKLGVSSRKEMLKIAAALASKN